MAVNAPRMNFSSTDLQVLLVEDNDGDARLVERYFQGADRRLLGGAVELHRARSLAEAIDWFDDSSCDIVLLDLGLPDTTGLATLKRLLLHVPALPVIILTGNDDHEIAFHAVREGAEDFLRKSDLDGDLLARSVRYAIERRERKLTMDVLKSAALPMLLIEVTSSEPTVIFANSACSTITGYSPEQWFEDGLDLLLNDQSSELDEQINIQSVNALKLAAQEGERQIAELRSVRDDGTWFWNEINAIPIATFDEAVTHVLLTFNDITERVEWRTRMAEFDRMTTLGTISMGIAHEINNPLAFVDPNVRYVLRALRGDDVDLNSEKTRAVMEDAMEDAVEGVARIQSVVNDLRQLAGNPETIGFETKLISVLDPLKSSLALARNHIGNRATLVQQFDDVPLVRGNASKLAQVFLNLLINAAQAIPSGDVASNEVRVSVSSGKDNIKVAVKDTGEGIEKEHQALLFKPFFSTKDPGVGTGLGLPISKYIVEQHGGLIEVDSVRGEGTTVTVVLSAAKER